MAHLDPQHAMESGTVAGRFVRLLAIVGLLSPVLERHIARKRRLGRGLRVSVVVAPTGQCHDNQPQRSRASAGRHCGVKSRHSCMWGGAASTRQAFLTLLSVHEHACDAKMTQWPSI
eukprot:364852-Chlamydomonas_euryale.AAC.7